MTTDAYIGIDLGTQSVRALVVSGAGEVFGSGAAPLTSHRDGPRHEQDPYQWWEAVATACRAALDGAPVAVRGVAVDATSGTVLLVDADGTALSRALMYDDTRAQAETERANEVGEPVWSELGYRRMQPSWALPKVLWLLDRCRDDLGSARLAHQSDFVTRRLVGHDVATDLSNALKTGAHLIDERWPAEVMDALGVPARMLPDLVLPGSQLGTICPEAAAVTGLPAGVPVLAGTTDGCASQLGAGALQVGSWNSVLGTTLVLKGVTADLLHDPNGLVYSHRSPDRGWLPGGASGTGAGAVARQLPGRDLDALAARADGYDPAAVVAYPLASTRGERFPFLAPAAEGFLIGEPSDDAHRYAALVQGVAYVERLCFDYLDLLGAPVTGPLLLTGGAARSRYWCQLRADVLGRPVSLPENAEPALGMAVLAASAGRTALEAAQDMVRIRTTLDPRPDRTVRYQAPYVRLVEELENRGWLDTTVADHARGRASL
jgi:sugar (pentulose or hexulose) kinase